ncbi:hypothetical protein [Variovorax sp. PAMC26660]|uniref:hypothetical protein n=1 Tax=Variovorax sp. PAMC26660 TaxID=2762322 RepID=UPI00164D1DFE|nr:hypothetical protein [Variovorax sp. PAMC26660]QNK65883.1 hypothetical protein H7F35_22055 [Variovorax sp. PAMC26660]
MSLAHLPNWAMCLLLFVLLVVVPAMSPLLGPSEVDAAQRIAHIENDRAAEYAASQNRALVAKE